MGLQLKVSSSWPGAIDFLAFTQAMIIALELTGLSTWSSNENTIMRPIYEVTFDHWTKKCLNTLNILTVFFLN